MVSMPSRCRTDLPIDQPGQLSVDRRAGDESPDANAMLRIRPNGAGRAVQRVVSARRAARAGAARLAARRADRKAEEAESGAALRSRGHLGLAEHGIALQ